MEKFTSPNGEVVAVDSAIVAIVRESGRDTRIIVLDTSPKTEIEVTESIDDIVETLDWD